MLKCRLLPVSIFAGLTIALLGGVVVSWIVSGQLVNPGILPLQMFLVIIILIMSLSLKVSLSKHEIVALSNLHKNCLYGRNQRDWQDVHSVRLRRVNSSAKILRRLHVNRDKYEEPLWTRIIDALGRGWLHQGFIVFDFRSGGYLPLPLAGISADQMEEFFIYLARFADPMALNADVLALQRDVLMGEVLRLEDSYTRMWEESLRERFEVTNFVPLQGGQELLDGQVQVLMQLACGGMSSVYLARLANGQRVILKELVVPDNNEGLTRKKIEEMFAREARILARLDHPQIVKVYDHFVENSRNYLILDRAHGLTLRQQIQLHGPFADKDAAAVGRQLAEITEYLHNFDPPVIHRDITPDNIVYDEETRRITLIDFGAATELVGHLTGTLIGKQSYIPVEQFRGKAVTQSDVYAIGGTLQFILTGADPEPIQPSHPKELMPSVSSELDSLVNEATATEIEDRIATAKELGRRLSLLS